MEASVESRGKLEGEKAQRIVSAMRQSVAARGASASTFDVVAREAGVSRGLLHYYFGSKERLLVEVVRNDCDTRIAALEERLEAAGSVDEIIESLVQSLRAFVAEEAPQAVLYEMISASRHSEEIRAELGELYERWREHLVEVLRQKEKDGVVRLQADHGRGRLDPVRARRRARHAADGRPGVGQRAGVRRRHRRSEAPPGLVWCHTFDAVGASWRRRPLRSVPL